MQNLKIRVDTPAYLRMTHGIMVPVANSRNIATKKTARKSGIRSHCGPGQVPSAAAALRLAASEGNPAAPAWRPVLRAKESPAVPSRPVTSALAPVLMQLQFAYS